MLNSDGKLRPFIKRSNSQPFNNLQPDEKVIAHWALCLKELLKFNYESFIGYDLDTVATMQQLAGLSSDGKGGVKYMNYMYSDKYDDEDKKIDKKGDIFAVLSVSEAIKKYFISAGDWPGVVCLLGKWYEKNIHTYQGDAPGVNTGAHTGRKFYPCELFKSELATGGVGDDCTSFCFACIQLYWEMCMQDTNQETFKKLIDTPYPPTSIIWGDPNNDAAKNMEDYGFEILEYSPSILQPWDMVMGSINVGASHGHGEIYVGPYEGKIVEFGWGSVHDGEGRSGMPAGTSYKEGEYSLIFRIKGIKKYTEEEVKELIEQYSYF